MASAGQAHAHNSQPMHFSSPSGHLFSWCRPWKRGAVGRFSSGYWTVSTFLNICRKVTPKPLTELRNSGTVPLLRVRVADGSAGGAVLGADPGQHGLTGARQAEAVEVRQIKARGRERGGHARVRAQPGCFGLLG